MDSAKVYIERENDLDYTVCLQGPYFLHRLRFEIPISASPNETALLMARGIASGLAMGFDAGLAAERVDPGQTQPVNARALDILDHIPASLESREKIRVRQLANCAENPRVYEWLGPLGGLTATFVPGSARAP